VIRGSVIVLCVSLAMVNQGVAVADDGTDVNTVPAGVEIGVSTSNDLGETIDGGTGVSQVVDTELADEFCSGLNWSESCQPPEVDESPEVTGEMAAQALQLLPLPPQTLIVQPPNGRTLVNFETNFYTDAPEELPIISVPILDRVVELRVWPASFTWDFGDGRSVTTTERGAPYPAMGVTHEYQRKGQVSPSLDTTYAAQWRLQGEGAWQPVDGTVTIEGAPAQLDVLTATPQLVG